MGQLIPQTVWGQTKRRVVRGSTLFVSATFLDAYGAPAEPTGVEITFNYAAVATNLPTASTYAMNFNSLLGIFTFDWDSTPAAPGQGFWSIATAETPQPSWANQGVFLVLANPANLGAGP